MFGFYDIKELTIGQMGIINKTETSCNSVLIDNKFILKKIPGLCNSWQYNYVEIFTGDKYRIKNREVDNNEIVIEKTFNINDYLTETELKLEMVSKYRLRKIYKKVNNHNIKNDKIINKRKRLSLHNV